MRDADRVVARGRGLWGVNVYDLEMVSNVVTREDSTGSHAQSITSYDLLVGDPAGGKRTLETNEQRAEYWQQLSDGTWLSGRSPDLLDHAVGVGRGRVVAGDALIRRSFATEPERAAFVEKWVRDLVLDWFDEPQERERRHPLASLVGSDLVFVTFVRDYVQLNFGGPPLNLYVWPRLHRASAVLKREAPGYADALIGLINAHVTAVDELLDLGLVLDFETGLRLTVPLDGTDTVGPEVAEFAGPDGFMVWRPGDEPIDWIPQPS